MASFVKACAEQRITGRRPKRPFVHAMLINPEVCTRSPTISQTKESGHATKKINDRMMAPAAAETMLIGLALAPLFDPPLVGAVELELGAERTVAEDAPGDVTDTDEAVVDAEVDDGGAVADADAEVESEVEVVDTDTTEPVTEAATLVVESVLDAEAEIEDAVCEAVVTVILVPSVPVPLGSAGFSMVKNWLQLSL